MTMKRTKAGDIPKTSPERLAELAAMTDDQIDTSDIPERRLRPRTYGFTIILAGFRELTVEIADALYEAGCDDSSPGSYDGVVSVHFNREAASLGDAVGSAIGDVMRAGFNVVSIKIDT